MTLDYDPNPNPKFYLKKLRTEFIEIWHEASVYHNNLNNVFRQIEICLTLIWIHIANFQTLEPNILYLVCL